MKRKQQLKKLHKQKIKEKKNDLLLCAQANNNRQRKSGKLLLA